MGVRGKLEAEVDIKCSGDVFHELFAGKPHQVSNYSPEKVHACEVHEGKFGEPGSVISWTYTLDGKKYVAKHKVDIDKDNKVIKFQVIESDVLKEYKSMNFVVQVIPKGEIDGIKWIIEFEKMVDDGPYPTNIMDFLVGLTRDVEVRHLNVS